MLILLAHVCKNVKLLYHYRLVILKAVPSITTQLKISILKHQGYTNPKIINFYIVSLCKLNGANSTYILLIKYMCSPL